MGSFPQKIRVLRIENRQKFETYTLEKMAGWTLPPRPENQENSWVGAASRRGPWNYKRRKHAARHPESLATLVEK